MGRTTGLLIAYTKCNLPAAEAAWAAWYDDTHLPDLLHHAVIDAHVFAAHGAHREKPEPSAALAKLTAAGRKHRCHTGAMTVTLLPSGRRGAAGLRRSDLEA